MEYTNPYGNNKIIKRYLSQRVTGYTPDFKHLYLLCDILYTDGTTARVTEVRKTIQPEARLFHLKSTPINPIDNSQEDTPNASAD